MDYVTYALFDDDKQARTAAETIKTGGDSRHRCGVVVQRDRLEMAQLSFLESGSGEGLRAGAVIGGLLGVIAGLFAMGPFGFVAIGGGLALGVFFGGIAGALGGSAAPDRRLNELSKALAAGKTLLVVEAPDLASRDQADAVLRANWGSVQHKPFF
jgi:hypothetical protein